jgi:cell division protein FtsB
MTDEQTIDAMSTRIRALTRANEVLRAQRNELFEAVRDLLDDITTPDASWCEGSSVARARRVLAKVEKWS